jgi:hypothetical protein
MASIICASFSGTAIHRPPWNKVNVATSISASHTSARRQRPSTQCTPE